MNIRENDHALCRNFIILNLFFSLSPPPTHPLPMLNTPISLQVDTNILNVDMAALGNAAPVATGDPTICSGCRAYLSIVSILRRSTRSSATTTTATCPMNQSTHGVGATDGFASRYQGKAGREPEEINEC